MCHAIIQCMILHGKMMLNACKTYEVKNNICFNQHLLVGFPEQLDSLHICKHETLQLVVSEFFLATCLSIYNVNFMMSHSLVFPYPWFINARPAILQLSRGVMTATQLL